MSDRNFTAHEREARLGTAQQDKMLGKGLARLGAQTAMLDAESRGIALYAAPKLNAFSLFSPGENVLSRVLADLFDPRGVHGQGNLYLAALLRELGLPVIGHHEVAVVRREVMTSSRRRIDLVIETPDLLIGIENKPWAAQQPGQLADYHAQICAWAGRKRPVLIFLSNQQPKTAAGDVLVLRYLDDPKAPSLRRLLAAAAKDTRAIRARAHVDEFIQFIDFQFEDEGMTDALDKPYIDAVERELSGDTAHRKAIAMVLLAHEDIHISVVDELGDFLSASVEAAIGPCERVGQASLAHALSEKWEQWGFRRTHWPAHLMVAIESGAGEHEGIYFGIYAPHPQSPEVARGEIASCSDRPLAERAAERVGGGKRTKLWPWWQPVEPSFWGYEFVAHLILGSSDGRVANAAEAQDLARRFIALVEAIEQELC